VDSPTLGDQGLLPLALAAQRIEQKTVRLQAPPTSNHPQGSGGRSPGPCDGRAVDPGLPYRQELASPRRQSVTWQ